MSQQSSREERKQMLLPFVVVLAFILHAAGIFFVQGMKVEFDSPKRAWFDQGKHMARIEHWDDTYERQKHKREEQLEMTLSRLVDKPVEIVREAIGRDINELIPETSDEPLSDIEIDDGIDDEMVVAEEIRYDLSPVFVESLNIEETLNHSIDLPDPATLVLSAKDNGAFTDRLVQATTLLKGEILVNDMENVTADAGIQVGVNDGASFKGTALQNRSGFLDKGEDLAQSSALPNIVKALGLEDVDKSHQSKLQEGKNKKQHQFVVHIEDFKQYDNMDLVLEEEIEVELGMDDADEIASIASSDDFSMDLMYKKRTDGRGYVFRIAIQPKSGVLFKRIKKNVFFLIDRSHSISQERFEQSLKAVGQAIGHLHVGDSFNILAFDKRVTHLSPIPLEWSKKNLILARDFLKDLPHGGLFASTDIYASLEKIVPEVVADNEVNIAVLLSDGDSYLKRDQQRKTIGEWTRKNAGKISLYSVASGEGNNLPLMQLLSSFNKGFLIYAGDNKYLSKTLISLMRGVSSPIGKDVIITAIPSREDLEVTLFPRTGQIPDLYENLPYVIYGHTSDLDGFHLFLQGKYYDKWFDIKHKISFSEAVEPTLDIERNWIVRRAYNQYYHYLADGDRRRLEFAGRMLESLNIQKAFR